MSFGDAISTCLNKYMEFGGRARRSEYWYFYLFTMIVTWVLYAVNPVMSSLASLALLLPSLAAAVRRMHDTNRSGWYLLIGLIPIVGWIIVIVALATDSDSGPQPVRRIPKACSLLDETHTQPVPTCIA